MNIPLILKILHVFSAMALVTGIVGRQLIRSQAKRATDLKTFSEFSILAGQFERKFVVPGSNMLALTGLIMGIAYRWPIVGFLQGASQNWLLVSNLLLLSMIGVIASIFVPRGKTYEKVLKEAESRQEITPQLRASFDDPIVRWAHRWEELALAAIIILMIAKPF